MIDKDLKQDVENALDWEPSLVAKDIGAGIVKTARVRLGNNVTIGLGSVIEIGVEIGSDSQIGALSFVPK